MRQLRGSVTKPSGEYTRPRHVHHEEDQELSLLAIENIYLENGVIDRRTLNEDEQLSQVGDESNENNDYLKSIPFDQLPWYRRPSVSSLLVPKKMSVLTKPEGVLALRTICIVSPCIRWCHRAESQPSPQSYLP